MEKSIKFCQEDSNFEVVFENLGFKVIYVWSDSLLTIEQLNKEIL